MNERNVAALAKLLERRCQETHDPACGCSYREDAEWFASRGVVATRRGNLHAPGDVIIYANDPAFHEPSYRQGMQDGENDVVADYHYALTEIPDFDWPDDLDFYPSDVVRVIQSLLPKGES